MDPPANDVPEEPQQRAVEREKPRQRAVEREKPRQRAVGERERDTD
jgi:hypothetical protein